jgi:diguanylate cyclase (GGDEF)-like protein
LCLATLVLVASFATALLRETPDYVVAALVVCAFIAAAVGVFLNLPRRQRDIAVAQRPSHGLPNRVLLDDRIEQAFRRSRRTGEPFTLIAIDLDGFKDVNDVRGHRAGTVVLKTLARRFESVVRAADTVARVGGDEFVVLSMGTNDDDRARALVGRLRHALRRPFKVDGAFVEIDGSIGWAVFPDDGHSAEDLLARADGQMYATKRDTSDENVILRRGVDASVVRDVETALERNELLVVYQPIIDWRRARRMRLKLSSGACCPTEGSFRRPSSSRTWSERPSSASSPFLVSRDAPGAAQIWAEAATSIGDAINHHRTGSSTIRRFGEGLTSMLGCLRPDDSDRDVSRVVPAGRATAARSERTCPAASPQPRASDFSWTDARPSRLVRCAPRASAR